MHPVLCINLIYIHKSNNDAVMRTNVVIDDDLMNEAMEISRLKTKKAAVEEGLKLLVRFKKQEKIREFRGKLKWEGDLEDMRTDKKWEK